MADRIVLNTISYHGHGAIENIVPELTARGYKKAFVCSDPDLIKFGVTKKVTDLLDAANFAYSVYSEIKPNPTIANVQDGVAAFKAAEADCIVTIGGGSSMDTAKAIGIIINNPEFADVRSLEGVAPTKKHAVFTIAVPTTAGTAAEVTINYVITDVEKNRFSNTASVMSTLPSRLVSPYRTSAVPVSEPLPETEAEVTVVVVVLCIVVVVSDGLVSVVSEGVVPSGSSPQTSSPLA